MHGTIMLYNHIYTKKTQNIIAIWTHMYINARHAYQTMDRSYFWGGDCVCEHVCVCTDVCVCWGGGRRGSEMETNMFDTIWFFLFEYFARQYLGRWQLPPNRKEKVSLDISSVNSRLSYNTGIYPNLEHFLFSF